MNQAFLIFSGYNQRAVLAFIRTLTSNNIRFGIITHGPEDSIYLSSYAKFVVCERREKSLGIDLLLDAIIIAKKSLVANIYFIAPSTESINRVLLAHKNKLNEYNVQIPLVDLSLYERISDKIKFVDLCRSYCIEVPGTYEKIDRVSLPMVAKPRNYYTRKGYSPKPQILQSAEDVDQFERQYDSDDFFLQEFIEGESIYLLYYFSKGGKIYGSSQKNMLQQPNGGSILLACTSRHYLEGSGRDFERMLSDLNFHGMVMIEVRISSNRIVMIEANPRFWGPSQLFVDAGMNFFESMLFDYGFTNKDPEFDKTSKRIYYSWTGGLLQTYKDGGRPVSLCKSDIDLSRLDLLLKNDVYLRSDTLAIFRNEIE